MWTLGICLLALAGPLAPVNPTVHVDDFLSVSCPAPEHCYLLDRAGNLFYSSDGGINLRLRGNHRSVQLRKLIAGGLIEAWAIDQRGGLWHSRDGGRSLEAMALPDRSAIMDIETLGSTLWLLSGKGQLFRAQGMNLYPVGSPLPGRAVDLFLASAERIAALDPASGLVYLSTDRAKTWTRSRPLGGPVKNVVMGSGPSFSMIVFMPGQVALAHNAGISFHFLALPEGVTSARPLTLLPNGNLLLGTDRGKLLLLSPKQESIHLLPRQLGSAPRAASQVGDNLIIVGDAGLLALAEIVDSKVHQIQLRNQSGLKLTGLGSPAPKVYWGVKADKQLLLSVDGGLSWKRRSPDPAVSGFSFVSAEIGYVLGQEEKVWGTRNGGLCFQELGNWPGTKLFDIHFIDQDRGWVTGDMGSLASTQDGGNSWTLHHLAGHKTLGQIQFVSPKHGWILADHNTLLSSIDGGRTWQTKLSGKGLLPTLYFVDDQTGWVGGTLGRIWHTQDAGASWTDQTAAINATVRALFFLDAERGIAVGDNGLLAVSQNGGQIWTSFHLATQTAISSLACDSEGRHCLLASDRGLRWASKFLGFFSESFQQRK